MKLSEVIQQPGQKEQLLKEVIASENHVSMPGIVKSYNREEQTVTVQLAIRKKIDGKEVKLPLLTDVPVFFPGNSVTSLNFPVRPGDDCLVVFADSCIDGWYQTGGVSSSISLRHHDYSDGFAFIGFRSRPKTLDLPARGGVFGFYVGDDGRVYQRVRVVTQNE